MGPSSRLPALPRLPAFLRLPVLRRSAGPGWAILTALLAATGYVALYGALDIDDTALIALPVAEGRFVWSPAHLLMQPAALVVYRLAGLPPDLLLVLRLINTACAATALGLGCLLLLRLAVAPALVAIAMVSGWATFALLQLATSGHVKLLALPWLMLGLVILAGQDARAGRRRILAMALAGASWGLASAFLASFALAGPAVAALVVLRALARRAWAGARRAVIEFAVLGAAMAAVLGAALLVGWHAGGQGGFFIWALSDSGRAETPGLSAAELARVAVGTLKSFVWSYRLPEAARAWLAGERAVLDPADPRVYGEAIALAAAALWLVLVARWAFGAWRRGGTAELALLGALVASLGFMIAWGAFEADFQFAFALLSVLAVALCPRPVALWATLGLLMAAANLGTYALPRLAVDMRATRDQLVRLLGPADLIVCGCAFSGRDAVYQYALPPGRRLRMVQDLLQPAAIADAATFYAMLEARVAAVLRRGGRVYMFDLLDPHDWSPPWPQLHAIGVRKAELRRRLGLAFAIGPAQLAGDLVYHELRPRR